MRDLHGLRRWRPFKQQTRVTCGCMVAQVKVRMCGFGLLRPGLNGRPPCLWRQRRCRRYAQMRSYVSESYFYLYLPYLQTAGTSSCCSLILQPLTSYTLMQFWLENDEIMSCIVTGVVNRSSCRSLSITLQHVTFFVRSNRSQSLLLKSRVTVIVKEMESFLFLSRLWRCDSLPLNNDLHQRKTLTYTFRVCACCREWSTFTRVRWSFTVVWRAATVCWTVAGSWKSPTMDSVISDMLTMSQNTRSTLVCTLPFWNFIFFIWGIYDNVQLRQSNDSAKTVIRHVTFALYEKLLINSWTLCVTICAETHSHFYKGSQRFMGT